VSPEDARLELSCADQHHAGYAELLDRYAEAVRDDERLKTLREARRAVSRCRDDGGDVHQAVGLLGRLVVVQRDAMGIARPEKPEVLS